MRRRTSGAAVAAALALASALAGCSLLTLPFQPLPGPGGGDAGPLGIGSCLDGMNAADSDRTALVPCSEPHLFEVTAIEEWPGMADALDGADGDAGDVWDALYRVDDSAENAEYGEWASSTCMAAGQRVIGIADVEVDGLSAIDIWLRVGGPYGDDLSLGSRDEFVDGDHRTVCALAWYEGGQTPQRVEGSTFSTLLRPGTPPERRECWDSEYYEVRCARPHAVQVVLGFEGLAAFGPELIGRVAEGEWSDEDLDTTDFFCEDLMLDALPRTADLSGLGYYAETSAGDGWDDYEDAVDPEGFYPFVCLAVGWEEGSLITGDIFDGDAESDGDGSPDTPEPTDEPESGQGA